MHLWPILSCPNQQYEIWVFFTTWEYNKYTDKMNARKKKIKISLNLDIQSLAKIAPFLAF